MSKDLQRYQTTSKEQQELDSILSMVENPVRREIIKRLSQEPSYPLQLSKELGVGQQLIAKHLDALEEAGIVTSSLEPSPNGPSRKEYVLKKSISLSVDFAPNLFSSKLIDLENTDLERTASKEANMLVSRIDKIVRSTSASQNRIGSIGKVISDIDEHLQELEDKKTGLLFIRNLAMSKAAKLIKESEISADTRRIMYHILDSHNKDVVGISESVNLREEIVRELLEGLEKDLAL
ncbi:MAG: ArsR family transcriptional regulator [archaeon]|nr:ArsR family transcriptional regulator [archaeon]